MRLSKFGILLRPWRKLLTDPDRRENMTQVRKIGFYPEIRTFHSHFFFLILFPYVQLTGTKWGKSIRENKINKHSDLGEVKTVEELSTIICKPIGNTKRCQEICQPNCARTSSHLLMWHGFRKGNSFQCDGQREELLYF